MEQLFEFRSLNSFFIAEFIAALAVVVSLIHLGIQMKQTRRQSIVESMDKITQERADFIKLLATESELSQFIAAGLVGASKLKPKDYFRFTSYLYYLFVQLELGHRKWKRGHVDSDLWTAWNEAVDWWLRCPGARVWWQNNPAGGFTPEFKAYIDQKIKLILEEPPELFAAQLDFLAKVANQKK